MSRIHELGRLSLSELIVIREKLVDLKHRVHPVYCVPAHGWNRDRLIAAIRDLEDPR